MKTTRDERLDAFKLSNHPGIGGNEETVKAVQGSLGKKITQVTLANNTLVLAFKDGTTLHLWDDGQSCCESRYMVSDDKLDYFTNTKLVAITLENAADAPAPDEYGTHEVQFLHVKTGKGSFTVSNHNEHTGCYGGFWIVASLDEAHRKGGE